MTEPQHVTTSAKWLVLCSGLVTLALILIEFVMLDNGEGIRSFSIVFTRDGLLMGLMTIATSVISVLVTFLFLAASFSARAFLKPLYFLVFAIIVCCEYSVRKAFGTFSTPQLAEIAFWAADWRIIRDAGEMYFNLAALVPITVYGVALVLSTRWTEYRKGALVMMLGLALIFFFSTAYFSSNTFPTFSLSAGFRTIVSFPTIWLVGTSRLDPKNSYYLADRERVDRITEAAPTNNVVLIVDESVRGDYLSVNGYSVRTTPTLARVNEAGQMRNWGISASGTTCSATSNNLMLTGLPLTELPDQSFEVFRRPTIFQFAKAMNYRTHLIDAQASSIWLGKPSDFKFVDEWVRATDLIGTTVEIYDADAAAAAKIDQIIHGSTGNFIWVTKFGVHRPYSASHPDSKGVPISEQEKTLNSPDVANGVLKHAYEKAIRYNSESFFATLFSDGPAPSTFYVYTSDHGQALGEGSIGASHCVALRGAAIVPLLLIAEKEKLPYTDTGYRASHSNIFPTILDLFGVPDERRKSTYNISLLRARGVDSVQRFFFSGDLHRDDVLYPFDP